MRGGDGASIRIDGDAVPGRSMTPKPPQFAPPRPLFSSIPQQQKPAFARSEWRPFWSGLAGGFLGPGAAAILFGPANFDGSGTGNTIGRLMQWLFFGGIAWLLWLRFRRASYGVEEARTAWSEYLAHGLARDSAARKHENFGAAHAAHSAYNAGEPHHAAPAPPPLPLPAPPATAAIGRHEIEDLLLKIQAAWSDGDTGRLESMVTPAMLHYLSEELAANARRGLANKVEQVQLHQAKILESGPDEDVDYITVGLDWQATDLMVRIGRTPQDSDYIASGNADAPVRVREIWNLTRTGDENWRLADVRQQ